jgi:Subtilase family/Putative Ig domain
MNRMTPGRLVSGALAFLAVIVASSAAPAVRPALRQAAAAVPVSPLMAFGGRSAAQQRSASGRKLDAALADLTRHAALARPGSMLDLRSLNPAVRFLQPQGSGPLVLIDAVTRGDPQQLKAALVSLGLRHPSVYSNDVSGWLPLANIDAAAARTEVVSMRAAMFHTRVGAVTSQGDFAQGSATLRSTWSGLDGSGVMVGVLSDSFNCYAVYEAAGSGVPQGGGTGYAPAGFTADAQKDMSTGDLPASVNVLEEAGQFSSPGTCMDYGAPQLPPYADEGRAILQVVHDVAPGASLAFYTASEGEADFANGITALASAGAKVIADDVGYFDEPFFQDGLVAQAVDTVAAQGVAYFSAAGNNGSLSYENTTPKFTAQATSGPNSGEYLLNFDASGATNTTSLSVTIPALQQGDFMAVVVEWDQPYVTGAPGSPGASSSIDLCISGAPTGAIVVNLDGSSVTCTGPNATGTDAVQVLIIGSPANATAASQQTTVTFQIGLANSTPAPGRIKLVVEDDGAGSTINAFDTHSPTLQGHPGAAGAAAVGAAFFANTPMCGTSPAQLESYSSAGGDPILFNTSGTRLATPVVRQKPEFVGPDGVNTTFFLYPLADYGVSDSSSVAQCANEASFPNFFGTSAATPHAAGAAALMLQANPAITPAEITTALENTAAAIGTTPNYNSGYGFIDADAAMASLPAGAPQLKLTPSTIYLTQSSTLSWLAVNSTSCTGSWSGAEPTSGSQTVTPTATGTDTYTLTCTSAAGSQSGSATLTVQAIPALSITSSSLPSGTAGKAYSATLTATGGIPPYSWSLTGGTLPSGLSLNAATGVISGTPAAAASATPLTFQVSDSEKTPQSKSAALSLTIAAAPSSGGGGAMEAITLLGLSGLLLTRLLLAARRGAGASAFQRRERRQQRLPVR